MFGKRLRSLRSIFMFNNKFTILFLQIEQNVSAAWKEKKTKIRWSCGEPLPYRCKSLVSKLLLHFSFAAPYPCGVCEYSNLVLNSLKMSHSWNASLNPGISRRVLSSCFFNCGFCCKSWVFSSDFFKTKFFSDYMNVSNPLMF